MIVYKHENGFLYIYNDEYLKVRRLGMLWSIADWIEKHGKRIGLVLIALPIVWDVALYGIRTFQAWEIHTWGVWCQLFGWALVAGHRYANRWGR